MLYDITLRISYRYDRPAAGGRHLLRLLPAATGGQRILRAGITVEPEPAERETFADFWGNAVTAVTLPGGHHAAAFVATARVERLAPSTTLDISPPLAGLSDEIAAGRSLAADAPEHFLPPSPRIPADDAIAAAVRGAAPSDRTARQTVAAVGALINAAMAFDPDATTVDTPPADAFRRRRGVCQDFAQVMIAGLRSLGVPAGYVSGFLRTVPPPGQPRLEGADAMHAWVRAWCGRETGWIDYDPTNAVMVGADHVVVATGRDYGDAAPVSGVLRTAGGQSSAQAVDVVPLPAAAG
jgi:transglutaminase-like putative cysteine protease